MKEKLKNILTFEKILGFYIVIQFIIDVATSLCVKHVSESLSVGIFVRTAFMAIIVIYALIKCDKKDKIKLLIYYAILGIYMLGFLFQCYRTLGTTMIMTQIKGLIKTFYLPIILVALLPLWRKKNVNLSNKFFIYALLGYTAVIAFGKLFNVSYLSYPLANGEGTMGLFYAANEIGIIISILSPFLVFELLNEKLKIINIVTLLFFLYASLELGTKVPFLNLIILIFVAIYANIVKLIREKNKKRCTINFIGIFAVVAMLIISMGYMPIAANISNAYGITFPRLFSNNENQYVPPEQVVLETPEEVQTAVYSSRNIYLKDNMKKYKETSLISKALGIGYLTTNVETGEVQELKLVEIDYCDIFLCHGIIGTIIYVIPIVIMAVIWFKNIFKNFKSIFIEQKNIFLEYSVLIALLVAFTAGHVFTAPSSAMFLVFSVLILDKKFKEDVRGE